MTSGSKPAAIVVSLAVALAAGPIGCGDDEDATTDVAAPTVETTAIAETTAQATDPAEPPATESTVKAKPVAPVKPRPSPPAKPPGCPPGLTETECARIDAAAKEGGGRTVGRRCPDTLTKPECKELKRKLEQGGSSGSVLEGQSCAELGLNAEQCRVAEDLRD